MINTHLVSGQGTVYVLAILLFLWRLLGSYLSFPVKFDW